MTGKWYPEGWRLTKLGELGEVNRGRSRHRPRYAEILYGGPYPFVQTGDIRQSGGRIVAYTQTYSEAGLAQSRLWPAGTMCITIAANIAETGVLTFPACFPDSVVGFIADKDLCDVYFIEYMFRYLRQRIQNEASGSVQDNINLATLDRLRFPIPPLSEQRAIAHILGTLDDKIELNRRMNATLEAMARALFKSWFVDFDPVRARVEGRDTGLPAEVAALFPDGFEASAVGEVPRGWRGKAIGDVVKAVGGTTPNTKEPSFWDGDICFATPKDLASLSSPILLDTERRITEAGLRQISSGLLPRGSVLMSSRAPIGYLAIVDTPVAVNQGFIAMVCDGPLPNHYVLHWVRQNMDAIVGNANGTTFLEISKANFRPIQALVPSSNVLAAFVAQVEPMHYRIVSNLKESRTLAALRDALLPQLISGAVRVGAGERFIEAITVTDRQTRDDIIIGGTE